MSSKENVIFMTQKPVIDGIIEDNFKGNLKDFSEIYKTNEQLEDVAVKYTLAYAADYLYLYIEAEAEEITYRDRAYQNGDGFHLTIAKPKLDGSETDEFYVLGFSPAKDWTNKMRWYYNVDLSMATLPDDVLLASATQEGKISFELLLPWSTIRPYHPWIDDNIGFNLCFVKAAREKEKIYHFIDFDPKMQSEQAKRKYVKLSFEQPRNEGKLFTMPTRFNFKLDQAIEIYFSGYFKNQTTLPVTVSLRNEAKQEIYSEELNIDFNPGLTKISRSLKTMPLESGNYYLNIYYQSELIAEDLISVLDMIDFPQMRSYLDENKAKINRNTYNTLQFYLNEAEAASRQLKYYESSQSLIEKNKMIKNYFSELEAGKDPLAGQTGFSRRAFLSKIDSTYRPYSLYLPENFSPAKPYPLLVYLHGSGDDDRVLERSNFIKEGFIVLAPNGRGTSNCYATAEAQIDIKEAIEDVMDNFKIDPGKIVLSGFSMGGYGVYRTYYQYPELFSGLAIISGHPNLAQKWNIENGINFLDEQFLTAFSSIPIFIYHGEKDLNCPFEIMQESVKLLQKNNAEVIFRKAENVGHGMMNDEIRKDYFNWLKQQR